MSETIEESFQLSPQQEQLWLGEPDGPSGRVQAIFSVTGPVLEPALREALRSVVSRHEILRTIFVRQPGIRVPVQVVRDALEPEWRTVQHSGATGPERLERLASVSAEELAAPMNLADGPLLRAAFVNDEDTGGTLLLTLSSLCADAASAAVLADELSHALGSHGELVQDPLQYADFAAWQAELATAEEPEAMAARDFWRGLDAADSPILPFSARSPAHPVASARLGVELDGDVIASLEEQASRYGAPVEAFIHAAWYAVLARSTASSQLAVTYVTADRRHADLEGAVGALSRSVPLRMELTPGSTFAEVVQTLVRARADAAIWQDYAPADGTAGFDVGFIAATRQESSAGISLEGVRETGRDLTLALTCLTRNGAPRVALDFDPSVISQDTASRLTRRLARVLSDVSDPGVTLEAIDVLDDAERDQLLNDFNATPAPAPSTVLERFAACAAGAPSQPAVVDDRGSLTYAELDARANQLAHHLGGAGVGPGASVGLCAERSQELIVGLLGILKAGAAYVPLHHDHPRARLRAQLETAGATAIVTQASMLPQLPDFDGSIVCLDSDRPALDAEPASPPALTVEGDELAYVIYTSGSTGAPKGVAVTHANLDNYAAFITERLRADHEPLSFGLVTSIATDLGNTSVFGALCSGGTLVLISPVVAADAGALGAFLSATGVDVLKITPSHIGALLAGDDPAVLPRRWLVIGGERAPWDLVDRVRAVSSVRIVNHYGPTEATIGCCTFDVPDGPDEYAPASVPIGSPIAGDRCYVLDERRGPVPLGTPGRLFVGGRGVARGYVGQPELTTERFVADPFTDEAGARMYDTGDLARWLPNGTIEFLGRTDEQVKIRGYRVELGEIEAVLRKHPLVSEAVVVASLAAGGDFRLVAYCQASGPTDPGDLSAHLQAWVPDFMVPSAIVLLDALPQTPSGKIDRQALPDPATVNAPSEVYVAPSTPFEGTIAAIWSQVLGVERIGIHADFFALGGHSLLATQIVAQVRSEFAVDLPLHSLFIHPTVATLAAEIVRMMGESEGDETAKLMAELEALSDDEAARLLADEAPPPESHA